MHIIPVRAQNLTDSHLFTDATKEGLNAHYAY